MDLMNNRKLQSESERTEDEMADTEVSPTMTGWMMTLIRLVNTVGREVLEEKMSTL